MEKKLLIFIPHIKGGGVEKNLKQSNVLNFFHYVNICLLIKNENTY